MKKFYQDRTYEEGPYILHEHVAADGFIPFKTELITMDSLEEFEEEIRNLESIGFQQKTNQRLRKEDVTEKFRDIFSKANYFDISIDWSTKGQQYDEDYTYDSREGKVHYTYTIHAWRE